MAHVAKILNIGATGHIGQHIALAAAAHPGVTAYALVSKGTLAKPERAEVLQKLRTAGVHFLEGELSDHASLVAALKQVTVVISAVGFTALADQVKIVDAIREAGTITRFLPSEFGYVDSGKTAKAVGGIHPRLQQKVTVAEAIKAAGIPYTLIACNGFGSYFKGSLGQFLPIQNDEITVVGSGDVKAITVDEADIGKYTILAALDPRTLNKTVRFEPPKNIVTHNELVNLAEKVHGKTYKRRYETEESLLNAYEDADSLGKMLIYIRHAIWIAGDHTQPRREGELSSVDLYPDVDYKPLESILRE